MAFVKGRMARRERIDDEIIEVLLKRGNEGSAGAGADGDIHR